MKLSFALLTVGLSLLISDFAQSAAIPGQHIPNVIHLRVQASFASTAEASYVVNLDTHRLTLTEGENSKTRGVKLSKEQVAEIQKLTAKVDATAPQYPEQPDATAGPYWYVTITDYILGYWQPERDTESRGLAPVVELKKYLDELLTESSREWAEIELRLIPKTDAWGKARKLSNLLEFAFDEQHKITVAEFRVKWAAYWMTHGKKNLVMNHLEQASKLWPPIRLQILDDPRFDGVFVKTRKFL